MQANATQANPDEDPHTDVAGTMEVTTEVTDGTVHTTYIFTSDDLKKKYGSSILMREEHTHYVGDDVPTATEKREHKNVKMKIIHENEADKLDKYQKAKNDGIPMSTYLGWEVMEPIDQSSDSADQNPILSFLKFIGLVQIAEATHVQKWAYRSTGSAYQQYDPIDIIITDTASASTDVLNAAVGRMNGNGWSATTCGGSSNLYVLINNVFTQQTTHEYKYIVGFCDQYHVRLWRITADLAIGAAHQEVWKGFDQFDIKHVMSTTWWEDNVTPFHVVNSWENGESQVRSAFGPTGGTTCWSVSANSHSMSNSYTREYWNTDRTTKLYSATNGSTASQINQISC